MKIKIVRLLFFGFLGVASSASFSEEIELRKNNNVFHDYQLLASNAKVHDKGETISEKLRKSAAQRTLSAGVGAQVCQERGAWLAVGNIDRVATPNIKVMVKGVVKIGTPGIHPQRDEVWSHAADWYPCH
ncbi:hypothetical protein CWC14_15075 [Pseudoalteromonas sp. S3260]|uniref:hypothetical protein n=1 Tax=Pseudoalteromonas sp. S3260 TaxID=579534 RepID=UPI00110A6131|nr:hypothetical protein [Pseudoalteromonas sp. S3260]TMO95175.1 hypothetical protein CWC14_15075 [Pseudoalteromonas sp. S3260]